MKAYSPGENNLNGSNIFFAMRGILPPTPEIGGIYPA